MNPVSTSPSSLHSVHLSALAGEESHPGGQPGIPTPPTSIPPTPTTPSGEGGISKFQYIGGTALGGRSGGRERFEYDGTSKVAINPQLSLPKARAANLKDH
ncbi:hypothetical protein PQX77_022342 [Marasmius sp. AFHP31]|nr:hypothetical protein PQX77_022342 [Marasmius sp. AFHP31]